MTGFGQTLRAAREAKGLTLRDIADKTHMMIQIVEDLENEKFGKIAAPIYGRGFVKMYCKEVGLDPQPLTAMFMEAFNAAQSPQNTQPPAPPPKREPAAPKSEPAAGEPDLPLPEDFIAPEPEKPRKTFRPPAPPPDRERPALPKIPAAFWRFLALGAGALAVLWLLGTGVKALYNATMTAPAEKPAMETPAAPEPAKEPPKATPKRPKVVKDREKITVPPLYID
ncbi:MAG: helix-turn-helix domain-containing protein [Kiritimatiellae bacterium]|nr:helix-turn-helix domain-containing protein [Kiritimatiellia bacterium]